MTRAQIERLFSRALRELDLGRRVEQALAVARTRSHGGPVRDVRVIAIGKAAPAMAVGALTAWGPRIERCLVVAPEGADARAVRRAGARAGLLDGVVVMRAGHPLPDGRSVRAGAACFEMVATPQRRLIVVLISGGASALVCAPAPGVRLSAKRAVTRVMLSSGAPVQDINVVRKHLSLLKGGGLARAAGRNEVLTVVASDVIAGAPGDVGSGPSVPDASSVRLAGRLLRRFAPSFADLPLVPTLSAASARRERLRIRRAAVVASPDELARAFAASLRARGFSVRVLPASQSTADELAVEYAEHARRLARGVASARNGPRKVIGFAVVRAAEPSITVSVKGRGRRGGRSCHTAALVGRELAGVKQGRRIFFAALASDGIDGASGTGGAVVDDRFADRVAARFGPTGLRRAIARFDTGTLHRAMATATRAKPTGHNLADLHVVVVMGRGSGAAAGRRSTP